jgi:single-strand DNA-binding protein
MADKSLNKAILIGRAGKDAEIRYTGNGKPVASFSIATDSSWKDKTSGQLHEQVEWHNIVAWERLAEICGEYVKKGKRVYIEGRIQNRSWDDKDGNKRYTTEIVANDLILLDGGPGANSGGEQKSYRPASAARPAPQSTAPEPEYEPQDAPVDDLPF